MAALTPMVHKKTCMWYRNTGGSSGVLHTNLRAIERQMHDDERSQTKYESFCEVLLETLEVLLISGNDTLCHVKLVG